MLVPFYPVNRAFYNSLATGTFGTSPDTVLSGDQVDQVSGDPELKVVGAGYMWYLTMNSHDVPALNNVNMRLALTNAVNRASIVKDVVKDGSVATYTAVPPQFATGPDGTDFSADQTMFSDVCSDDATKAAQYYDKAKQELGQDSFTFELLLEDQTETQNVAAVLKEEIESALPGVTLNLKVELKKQRVEDIQNGNYQVCLTRWGPDYADPMTYLGMWVTGNSNNYGLWSSADYDKIIADCTTGAYITDASARWKAMYDAEKIVMDQPLYIQFGRYVLNLTKGDLGVSYNISKNTPISQLVQTRLPVSIKVGGMAVGLGALVGLLLGIIAALNHGTILDSLCTIISVLGVSVPSYVFALGLSYMLGFKLAWLLMLYNLKAPFVSSVMPGIALSMFTMASIARFARNEMMEVMGSDYMLLAESKGISGAALIVRHALRKFFSIRTPSSASSF